MIKEVLMGKLGLTMETGTIVSWLKNEGDLVQKGEPLFEVETDKATQVINSFHTGYLKKILVLEGEEVPVKTTIAYIGEKDDTVPKVTKMSEEPNTQPVATETRSRAEAVDKKGRVNASPLAKRLALELGIDLAMVAGSGPDGRIGKEDVLAAKTIMGGAQATPKVEEPALKIKVASQEPLTGIRKIVAQRMKRSYTEAPHIHLELWADMTEASRLRDSINKASSGEIHVTYTDIVALAAARTLRKNMRLNASLKGDNVVVFDEINIGIAVATEKGLVVVVLKDADRLKLSDLSLRRQGLVQRTKSSRQTTEDLSGGTFTITNLGMFGIVSFKPIINTDQAAILAMGRITLTAVADDSKNLNVKPLMNLSLGCDHRIVDGADGAKFLSELKETLEKPESGTDA
jgi:pyruvate dehydrogenase E2 component (dihydrolipoamide acetyltransferase)